MAPSVYSADRTFFALGSVFRPAAANEISWVLVDRCTHKLLGHDHRKKDKVILRLVI